MPKSTVFEALSTSKMRLSLVREHDLEKMQKRVSKGFQRESKSGQEALKKRRQSVPRMVPKIMAKRNGSQEAKTGL